MSPDEVEDDAELLLEDDEEEDEVVPMTCGVAERLLSELEQPASPRKQIKANEDIAHRAWGLDIADAMMIPFCNIKAGVWLGKRKAIDMRSSPFIYCDRLLTRLWHGVRSGEIGEPSQA